MRTLGNDRTLETRGRVPQLSEDDASTDDEHRGGVGGCRDARRHPEGWVPATRRGSELAHCPEAIAALQERQNATAQLAQVLPPAPRDVVLGRV